MTLRFEYDTEAGALYVYTRGEIPDGGVARTIAVAEGIYLDADAEGRTVGIEFLDLDCFRTYLERHGGVMEVPEYARDLSPA
jgi:uncharacterized protein YuzE